MRAGLIRDRYEVVEQLGAGGQGDVLRAIDHLHSRPVALKRRPFDSEETRQLVLQEARILFGLRPHPGITLVREDFFIAGNYYLVMDWVEGTDLDKMLGNHASPGLDFDLVVGWMGQVAAALEHLHRHQPAIIHQDVKPANIVVTPSGQAVLVDFGIARVRDHQGPGYGTPGFLAPEIQAGNPPTPASDVYGLAATTLTLLTGIIPGAFGPVDWSSVPEDRVTRVQRAFEGGLALDPQDRPSATEFVASLLPSTRGPSGTVTLLFTDVVGSTRLWETDPDGMRLSLAHHDELMRGAIEHSDGYVFKTTGDGFCAAFASPTDALDAAIAAQRALIAEEWPDQVHLRVRMGMHSGMCDQRGGDYFGPTVNRVARLMATGHGGQTLLSKATVDLLRDTLREGVRLRDLGEHRLKDLGRAERLFQVEAEGLEVNFPPLRSLDNPELRHNLPEQVSSFVGRDLQLAEVRTLLRESRLVTLTGAGGCGKTRLALHVAADLLDGSGQGVWLVDLAPMTDPNLVAWSVASVLGVREEPGRSILDTLAGALRDRSLLVVLDNCEHVLKASATVADTLVRSCPQVVILATSREPLGLSGERVYRVPSLSLPQADVVSPEAVQEFEAVRLFMERARPGFVLDRDNATAVTSICRHLDGIPLAIELAAARLRSLSVHDIEDRLDSRFRLLTGGSPTAMPRQQTLRALIDWSFDLLDDREKHILCQLSVFAGGFTLDAAEAVCAGEPFEVLDRLGSLVDKSLVLADPAGLTTRYRLLETVRQYAAEHLRLLGPDELDRVAAAHAHAFLSLAETAARQLTGAESRHWLSRLDLEHDNLRAALLHFFGDPNTTGEALRLATSLHWFWIMRGYYAEGVDGLETALQRPDAPQHVSLRAHAINAVGQLRERGGDYAGARARFEEGLDVARRLDDPALLADLLCGLGWIEFRQGARDAALSLSDEAVTQARRSQDPLLTARTLDQRARVSDEVDRSRSRADYAEALTYYRAAGLSHWVGITLNNLGCLELMEGDVDDARANLEAALAIARDLGLDSMLPALSTNLGFAATLQGDPLVARRSFAAALSAARRLGAHGSVPSAVVGLALCATEAGDRTRAATLHGAADGLLDRQGVTLETLEASLRDHDQQHLRHVMGERAFDRAYQSGRLLGPADATELALQAAEDHQSEVAGA